MRIAHTIASGVLFRKKPNLRMIVSRVTAYLAMTNTCQRFLKGKYQIYLHEPMSPIHQGGTAFDASTDKYQGLGRYLDINLLIILSQLFVTVLNMKSQGLPQNFREFWSIRKHQSLRASPDATISTKSVYINKIYLNMPFCRL